MMNMNFSPEMMNLSCQIQNIKNNLDFIGLPINLASISLFNLTKTGIQILNLCIEYTKQNMLINNNIKTTFQNIRLQIKNLELVMNNYELNPNLMFQNEMMMNMGIMNDLQINDSFIPKMNIIFITRDGTRTNLIINRNTSVKDCINTFFERRIDLKKYRDEIYFTLNGEKINENNNIDVWTFFGGNDRKCVSVHE